MIELTAEQYPIVEKFLDELKINTYFCKSVICHHTDGRIFVDEVNNPKSFYIIHSCGMTLLFGDYRNHEFNSRLLSYLSNESGDRVKDEWMQIDPLEWQDILKPLLDKGRLKLYARQNFKFDKGKYNRANISDSKLEIVETTKDMFNDITGLVIPKFFWKNAGLFNSIGKGFSLIYNGKIASTAYSAYMHGNKLEIGIETMEEFRGKGFALAVSSALIDYCLENSFEPVWSCRLNNIGSVHLAQKLGFVPTVQIPYYHVPA